MPDETYETPDLYYSAALMCLGQSVQGVIRRSGRVFWSFTQTPELKSFEFQWMNNTLVAPLRAYAESVKNLKSMVHMPQGVER